MPDIDAGIIEIDGSPLPGALRRLSVGHAIIIDEIQIQDKDGHLKQPAGYDEGTVEIELTLYKDKDGPDPADQLAKIQEFFKQIEGQLKPKVHDIYNYHVWTRGIKQVLFRELRSEEDNQSDTISVTIILGEYIPLPVQLVQAIQQEQAADSVQNATDTVIPENSRSGNRPDYTREPGYPGNGDPLP